MLRYSNPYSDVDNLVGVVVSEYVPVSVYILEGFKGW